MRQRPLITRYQVIVTIALLIVSSLVTASTSNKWRLQFSGGAHSDGVIVLEFTPVGNEPLQVDIQVANGTSENKVAKVVTARLREALPEKAFHVERDDGEDVLIKKRRGAANFGVRIIKNTVQHVRINPDRE